MFFFVMITTGRIFYLIPKNFLASQTQKQVKIYKNIQKKNNIYFKTFARF